jgi:hypothetical protein
VYRKDILERKSFFQKFYVEAIFFISITILVNSCLTLSSLEVFWNTLLFMDTVNERYGSDDRILLFIENKTDEILVVRSVGFDGQMVGAELIRISKHKEVKIKITKGRKINIIGGNTGVQYLEMECNVDSETVTVYPCRFYGEVRESINYPSPFAR